MCRPSRGSIHRACWSAWTPRPPPAISSAIRCSGSTAGGGPPPPAGGGPRADAPRPAASAASATAVGRAEGLAAVTGAVQRDAQHVQVLLVGGIDADLAEVHGPRVDAVDARPRVAAVGG